jgi:crossover junction endodeoxyribonuclease RuvC
MMSAMSAKQDPRQPCIIGIDPGLQCTGYAFLTVASLEYEQSELLEAGVVRLQRGAPLEYRLIELEDALVSLVEARRPVALACEALYAHYRHPRTAILMAHARGVVLALAARRGIPTITVPATQAKKLLTGSGHATKAQMQQAVQFTLNLPEPPEPHDVADAIAIGLAGCRLRAAGAVEATAPDRTAASKSDSEQAESSEARS